MKPGSSRGPVDRYVPNSGNHGYRTTHYDLELTYRLSANRLAGTARIDAVATEQLNRFSLDLVGLAVSRVSVDGKRAEKFEVRGGKLLIAPRNPIADGDAFRVEVGYAGNPRPISGLWGEVGWEELRDGTLVASQPNGAPSWFPCNDHPSDKASYRLSITADKPYLVAATGSLISTRTRASATTWLYELHEPTASYLVSIQIGRYVRETSGSVPEQIAVLPASLRGPFGTAFERQGEMLDYFVERFGPYPFDTYTVVVTDDDLEIPVEAQSMSIFGANHTDGRSERLIAHELAHQWFGNSLTIEAWCDIWLNEGFACYAEWIWSEQAGAQSADELAAHYHGRLARLPRDLTLADPGAATMFDDRVYKRGALALHALRRSVGDDAFFGFVRGWTAAHRHASVSTQSFLSEVAEQLGGPARKLLKPWLFETAVPSLR